MSRLQQIRREWASLQSNMQKSIVFTCEPVEEPLHDDGERSMRQTNKEWYDLHETFLRLLKEMDVSFNLLSYSTTALDERVGIVLKIWEGQFNGCN
ncbi:uncharacterized protein A1O5_13273 [Cladophialophora psammophila CBS 110553]|uniref:Uncharacterized protein n=1 Tax=Cladophialophora psammophila CBS 110553 TaxID=1182543 RepID=W9VD09_9EURO|nr:uncharacterized protein A1O5_13273 [Cladophialophora psammophila CBS 110553]EXJ53497.1 hypothetical protein A1O5_13273 [Cladophialophora psammophila CBS 110553]